MHYLLILFFLVACTHADQWTVSNIRTKGLDSALSRFLYRTEDKINGIDIEIIGTKERLTTYLQVHSQMIPAQKSKGEIVVGNQVYPFLAEYHAGGQRLGVPEDIQMLMIELLKQKKSFVIKIEGYEETVSPSFQNLKFL